MPSDHYLLEPALLRFGVTIRAPEPLAGWARLWAARALSDAGWRVATPAGGEE